MFRHHLLITYCSRISSAWNLGDAYEPSNYWYETILYIWAY